MVFVVVCIGSIDCKKFKPNCINSDSVRTVVVAVAVVDGIVLCGCYLYTLSFSLYVYMILHPLCIFLCVFFGHPSLEALGGLGVTHFCFYKECR